MTARTVIAAVAITLGAATAHAGEPRSPDEVPQRARSLAERGRALHDAGDYGNAIVAFKEAYVMAPSPGLLFNLGQAYRLQGNCDDASLMYRRYLNTGPSPEARRIALTHLASVERCVQQRGLAVRVDQPGGALQPPAPDGTVFAEPPRGSGAGIQNNLGLGLAIGGGIALSAAAYFAFDAHSASSSVEEAYANGARWKDVEAIDQRGKRSARLAKVVGISGGVAVVGGVTLYLLGRRAERLVPIALVPTRHGAEVTLAWRF